MRFLLNDLSRYDTYAFTRLHVLCLFGLFCWFCVCAAAGCDSTQAPQVTIAGAASDGPLAIRNAGLLPASALDSPRPHPSNRAEFEFPHPERLNPFRQPNTSLLRNAKQEARIRVKGFVNVDGLSAVLVWDGTPMVMRAGESRQGLRLLSIEPPSVVLELNGVRMVANLKQR